MQALQRLLVSVSALALVHYRRSGFARHCFFDGGQSPPYLIIPVQAEGFERVKDVVRRTRHTAWRIEVFHAHQPDAVMVFCVEIATDCGGERAEMQGAGGGRGEAAAILG